jgi:hypothetical protein
VQAHPNIYINNNNKKKISVSGTASSQFHQNNQYLNMGNCCFHFVKKYKEKHIGFVLLYNFPEIELKHKEMKNRHVSISIHSSVNLSYLITNLTEAEPLVSEYHHHFPGKKRNKRKETNTQLKTES